MPKTQGQGRDAWSILGQFCDNLKQYWENFRTRDNFGDNFQVNFGYNFKVIIGLKDV